MDTSTVVDLGRQALWMTVIISAPLLGVGGWQITTLVDYTRSIFQRIPGLFA